MGTPEAELTLAVDVTEHVAAKRAAIRCHRSQITDSSFFLEMPDEVFAVRVRHRVVHRARCPAARQATGWIFEPS